MGNAQLLSTTTTTLEIVYSELDVMDDDYDESKYNDEDDEDESK